MGPRLWLSCWGQGCENSQVNLFLVRTSRPSCAGWLASRPHVVLVCLFFFTYHLTARALQ